MPASTKITLPESNSARVDARASPDWPGSSDFIWLTVVSTVRVGSGPILRLSGATLGRSLQPWLGRQILGFHRSGEEVSVLCK